MLQNDLTEINNRALSGDLTVINEIHGLIIFIRELLVENQSYHTLVSALKNATDEKTLCEKKLIEKEEILRNVARLVQEYAEENEVTDVKNNLERTIEQFLNQVDGTK